MSFSRPGSHATLAYTYIREERQVKVKRGKKADKGEIEMRSTPGF